MMKNIKIELEPKRYYSASKSKNVANEGGININARGKLADSGSQTPLVIRGFAEIRNR